jgi:hypothetical protein
MRLHDRLHTYIYEEKVDVHIYLEKKRFATCCVYTYRFAYQNN